LSTLQAQVYSGAALSFRCIFRGSQIVFTGSKTTFSHIYFPLLCSFSMNRQNRREKQKQASQNHKIGFQLNSQLAEWIIDFRLSKE
tara:strand:- start:240 stop:497 length:258 start_codon:yes stop_codon:yes gene_type:complete